MKARIGTRRGIWAQTIYLGAAGALLMLSLPPEIGRGELRDVNLLLAFLIVQLLAATYLTSGFASAELALDGEKSLPDLVLSAFSPGEVATGKLESSALYAAYLIAVALPLATLAASLRGTPLAAIVPAGLITVAIATAVGTWGAWLGGRFPSDFTRSFIHWVMLTAVFAGTALLPAPWRAINPLRLVEDAVRVGWSTRTGVAIAGYLAAALGGTLAIAAHVRHTRGGTEVLG